MFDFRSRIRSLLTVGMRYPTWALWGVVCAVVASLALVVLGPLEVSTSRRNLVSQSSPHQARLFRYYEQFGRADVALLVISGSESEQRRRMVDAFQAQLRDEPQLQDRVLGKLDVESVAETLLLWRPELLQGLVRLESTQPGTTDAPDTADHWVLWARAFEARIMDQLEGGQEAPAAENAEALGSGALELAGALLQSLSRAVSTGSSLTLPRVGPELAGGRIDEHGYITTGDLHLVLIFPNFPSDEGRDVSPMIDRLRAAAERARQQLGDNGVRAELTGLAPLATDELRAIQSGTRVTSILSTLGILVVMLWMFRSFWHPVAALVPLLTGIAISLGFVELVYGQLNLVTSSFMSVLLGLGIDFGIHLLHRYSEGRDRGSSVKSALEGAMLLTGPGVAVGALTTVVAFLSTTTTQFAAFRQLGVITAFGLAAMMMCAFLLFPVLLPRLAGRSRLQLRAMPGATMLARLGSRWARAVVAGAAVVTVLGLVSVLIKPPAFNGRYFEFLPQGAESYAGLSHLVREGQFSPAEVHFPSNTFEDAAALTKQLRDSGLVAVVQSPTDLVPEIDPERLAQLRRIAADVPAQALGLPTAPNAAAARIEAFTDLADALDEAAFALRQADLQGAPVESLSRSLGALIRALKQKPDQGQEALDRVSAALRRSFARAERVMRAVAKREHLAPSDLPPIFRHRYVSLDGQRLTLHAQPAGDAWDPAFSERFTREIHQIAPDAAGLALNVVVHQQYITSGFARAALLSFFGVLLILRFVFQRWGDALLAMLPVTLGFSWMLTIMRPLGLEFTSANMVALPLVLGIGLDAGIHMIYRCREAERRSEVATLTELLHGTGSAVGVAALTTMIGFAALMFASHRAMSGLGLLLTLGIGLSLTASVVVLPSALVLRRRLR